LVPGRWTLELPAGELVRGYLSKEEEEEEEEEEELS